MPSCYQKKRSKQRAEYLQKQDENKAKARALYMANPENKKAFVSASYKADQRSMRQLTTQILNLSDLLKGGRTSRSSLVPRPRFQQLRVDYITATWKVVGIGMNPLSDWLNVLPRGRGATGVTELPLSPKGMLWHVLINIKKQHLYSLVGRPYYRVWSGLSPYYLTKRGSRARPTMYNTDLHKTICIHFTCKACMVTQLCVYCFNLIRLP